MAMKTDEELDELVYSSLYAEYIMDHGVGDRVICNGHTLLVAMEELYLFTDFLASISATKK